MKSMLPLAAAAFALLGAWSAGAAAQDGPSHDKPVVLVELALAGGPEVAVDGLTDPRFRAAYLEELRAHLERRAGERLAAGQTLAITVTEVVLAGRAEPWRRHGGDVRILRDVYPPRVALRFRLTGPGGVVAREGERSLSDTAYMATVVANRTDPLRWEKALLDRWVDREL